MFDPRSIHKVWKWLCICENKATIDNHHGSAPKLRNTCRRSFTQRLVSWSIPVVPKVWVETQTKVKGQKMRSADAIQTWAVYIQRYFCFSMSVCSIGTWEKLTLKLYLVVTKIHSYNRFFFHTFFEVWVARSSNSDMGGTQKIFGSANPAMLSLTVEVFVWIH